ncbi:hypothetical protein XF30_10535 [Bradyrhizobium sp. SUTN9-2]|nr:hypothetical protein XF30_10535 [Bradyrhizobium sp. SUTN9-2]
MAASGRLRRTIKPMPDREKQSDLPQISSSSEFAQAMDLPSWDGASDGSWRGAIGIAQRQIPARVAGEGELGGRLPSEL